jgi:PPP family 3-phenylpropionic acid transporter
MVMRVLYFLYFGALGAFWTFQNVYYKDIGLSGTQIGLVNTVSPLVSIFAATMWGIVNDRLGRPRMVLRIIMLGVIGACFGMSLTVSFVGILVYSILMSFFISAVVPLMDNTTLRLLDEHRGHYGRYRVGGSIGFILASVVSGYVYEVTGLHAIFYAYIGFMLVFLAVTSLLPNQPVRIAGSVWSGLGQMIRQPAWVMFAVTAFLLWVANTGSMNFIGITVQQMGGSDSLIGIVWMASSLIEIPIMVNSDRLLRRFGPARLVAASLGFFTLRGLLMANIPSPEWAAGIAMLGGLSFSLFWISSVSYANESAPEHMKNTSQGLLFSVSNLGSMFGSLNAGWLFDSLGFRGLYWVMAAVSGAALVIFLVGSLTLHRRSASPSP